jgi:hypothetical protein
MAVLKKDERKVRQEGDKFVVQRLIEEEYDAENFLRVIAGLEHQQQGVKKQIAEVDRKIIQQIRKDKREQLKEIESILEPLKNYEQKAKKIRESEINVARQERENVKKVC